MTATSFFDDRLGDVLGDVRRLVEIETPTGDVAGVTTAIDILERTLDDWGEVGRTTLPGFGPVLQLRRPGRGPRVLIVGHVDTVWPVGSWNSRWTETGGRIAGPGIYDMKAGLTFVPWLRRWFDHAGVASPPIEVIITPDEEIGSIGSRPLLEEAARRSDLVLVLEPTVADRCLKVARKGSGEYRLIVHGRGAHQGVEPEKGVNAVLEGARLALEAAALSAPERGTTVGPNVIHGGSASNMVADRCEVRVDVRVWTREEELRLDAAIHDLRPQIEGARLVVEGGWNRPPMVASDASMAIYEHAATIGRGLGFNVPAARWGGSSDANITSAVGTPTVDGFGPVGGGAHHRDEHIVIAELAKRLALFTETVAALAHLPPGWPRRH